MKKSTFYTLIVIAGISLAGLIGVQAYWIHHAYTIKEQQFSQLVNTTLNRITEDVQSYEVVLVIREMDTPYPFQRNMKFQGAQKSLLDTIIAGRKQLELPHLKISKEDKNVFWNNAIRHYWQPQGVIQQNFMQINAQFDGSRSSMQISGGSSTSVMSTPLMSDSERKARRKVLIEATIARMQQADFNLEDRVDSEALDYIIRSEMKKSDLCIPFEYAVFGKDCQKQIYRSESFTPKKENEIFRASLFPFDWFESQPYYLNIYFPKQGNYLFRSIGFMSMSSIVFTLVVIFAFAATIYQMQRQKKITSIRTDFVNNVTHELKTPISTISLASQMLNDKTIPNESKNYDHLSTVIADESRRLSQQVEKILQMAIFDHGKLMIKFKELDVNELAHMVVRNMLIQVKNKNGQIIKNLDAVNSVAEADEVHFTNVLFNLIDNAVKYSGGRPDITISTADTPDGLSVSIQDRGIGISKADQKRIFDQFYRVSTGNVHNVKGFGLGLSYVKNVVRAHSGRIEVESEPGHGTRFTVFLRRHQPKKDKSVDHKH
ncbi:MAG: HAMP domain-containing histidine kinase [Bacteroidales bacterium]|jgi:signal transduction histidine kinase|nr:HAMP domain-containing histidine kinase [Bacteroidales bacterium]